GSIWNAHVVILPFALMVVSCAALTAGDPIALPIAIRAGSFVAQTDIALLPCVSAAGAIAVAAIVARRSPTTVWSSLRWRLALCIAAVVWAPTLYEQVTGAPGNLTRIWQYLFVAPHTGQSLRTAFVAWSDITTAFVRKGLVVGWGAAYQPPASALTRIGAVAQLAGLT